MSRYYQLLKWWPMIAALAGGTLSIGSAGVYAAVTDHNAIAANTRRIDALEAAIPKMQTDIQVICWTVANGQGCSIR